MFNVSLPLKISNILFLLLETEDPDKYVAEVIYKLRVIRKIWNWISGHNSTKRLWDPMICIMK